jgi:hypothetical protein
MPRLDFLPALPSDAPRPPRAQPAPAPATVFLPKEHGSWSLALEPLALGLLIAPSLAGAALAVAALAGFFARRPLQSTLAAGQSARRRNAGKTLAVLSAAALAGFSEAVALAGWAPLWPLLAGGPLGLIFVYFDAQGEARAAAAEVAGSAAFALLPAAIAALAGWPAGTALALAALALARNVPAVLTVRTCLRRLRQQSDGRAAALLAAGASAAGAGWLAATGNMPWIAAGVPSLLLARTVLLTVLLPPRWPARRLGQFEATLGALCLALSVLAYRWQ